MATREIEFITGVETPEQPAVQDPSNDGDLITKGFADKNYQQGKQVQANIAALKAVLEAERKDGDVAFVKDINEEYYFDSGSAATGDDDFVLVPDAGTGRWLKRTILNKQNSFTDTTSSTNATTGAIVTAGGLGVAENLNVGGDATVQQDLTVIGNFDVQGSQSNHNVTDLTVSDANIEVNNGGTQATADMQDAGFTVLMSDATNAKVGYDSTTTSKFKAGEVGAEQEILTTGHEQTITANKEFDVEQTWNEVTTPASNPPAGKRDIYFKSDGQLYQLDSSGVEKQIGTTSTPTQFEKFGFTNNLLNYNFEEDIANWNLYDDASATPVDGTGGSPVITSSRDAVTPIRGTGSLRVTKPAATNAQGQGISSDFTLDEPERGRNVRIQFDWRTGANYVNDDVVMQIYRTSGSPGLIGSPVGLPASTSARTIDLDVGFTTDTDFRIIFHISTSALDARDFWIDNVVVGNKIATTENTGVISLSSDFSANSSDHGLIDLSSTYSADDTRPGLLNYHNTATVVLDNDFTGGTRDITIERINNTVTITGHGTPSHAANPTPESSSGLIPTWARPSDRLENCYFNDLTNLGTVFVESDGTIGCNYFTYSNTVANRGNTSSPLNISYVIT